jgi:hypothetical protein
MGTYRHTGTQVWVCSGTHCPQGSVGRVRTRHYTRWTIWVCVKKSMDWLFKGNIDRKPCFFISKIHSQHISQESTEFMPGCIPIASLHILYVQKQKHWSLDPTKSHSCLRPWGFHTPTNQGRNERMNE